VKYYELFSILIKKNSASLLQKLVSHDPSEII